MENQSLVLDLVEWIDKEPRLYDEVMEAWRTSCPRLSIWEDAVAHGLVIRKRTPDNNPRIFVTKKGRDLLKISGRLNQEAWFPGQK